MVLTTKCTKAAQSGTKKIAMPLVFEEVKMECGYGIDLLVENKIVNKQK